jgi:prevent-host-death family protein
MKVELMPVMNATALRKNLFGTIEDVVAYNEPVTITSKSGNVVMISESDYNALMETVYLMSNPSFMEGYKEAKKQDRSTYEKLNLDEEW